jgi:tetratricopeptide (TPR) repeat protein
MRRLALFYVLLLVLASGCATTSGPPARSADQLREVGQKCLEAGETAEALKYLTEAEQKKPGDASIEYDLALAYDQRGLQDKALSHLQNALKIKPDYPEALNALGSIYALRGQFEPARVAFQKALDDPFYKTPQLAAYNLGRLYERNGDIERALTYYQQAVKFDQNYAMAWLRIGQALEQLRRSDEARHAYGNAVRLSPNLAEAQLRFGILSYMAGNLEAAAHSLGRVGEIAPNTDMADEARRYLEKVDSSARKKTRSHSSSYSLTNPGEGEVISADVEWAGEGTDAAMRGSGDATTGVGGVEKQGTGGKERTPSPLDRGLTADVGSRISEEPGGVPPPTADTRPPKEEGGAGSPSYRYMVQIGSFLEKEKAEEIKSRLQEKGYKAVVKTLKDRALGNVFVIQLQPVNSISNATTLMTQLGGEIDGKPVIIKVPVVAGNPQPAIPNPSTPSP